MPRQKVNRSSRLLDGARVYLSGPMDFVASREDEKKNGWRARVGEFLRQIGCIVFDPWQKPEVRGLQEYGREGVNTDRVRAAWTFEDSRAGAAKRARLTGEFWETLHIDLRMVDTSDFTIAYCPTNIYSVGTPHEIALSRLQRKPVLLVSPVVEYPSFEALRARLAKDRDCKKLLDSLEREVPLKPNPRGIPSLWYMPLVGGEGFFDGFGFARYHKQFRWPETELDRREKRHKPERPLLPFLKKLAHALPKKWDANLKTYVRNDDWLLWRLNRREGGGEITDARVGRA